MANENLLRCITLKAAADLSAKQYYAVKLTAERTVNTPTNGDDIIGILQNDPSAAGQAATVAIEGSVTKAVGGGSISAGAKLAADTGGKIITAATNDAIIGVALEDASDGAVFQMLLRSGAALSA